MLKCWLFVFVLLYMLSVLLFGSVSLFVRWCVVLLSMMLCSSVCVMLMIFGVSIGCGCVVVCMKCVLYGVFFVKLSCVIVLVGVFWLLLVIRLISFVSVLGWLFDVLIVVVYDGVIFVNG